MKTSLYEISNDYLELMKSVEDAEGELTPEMQEALEINEANLQVKAKGYIEIIKSKEGLDYAIDLEIKRLQAIKKRNGNVIDALKERLLGAVQLFGDFEVGLDKFSTRKSQSLKVLDAKLIPKKFKVKTVTEAVQKAEVKKAIKAGEIIEGVDLITNYNLAIK